MSEKYSSQAGYDNLESNWSSESMLRRRKPDNYEDDIDAPRKGKRHQPSSYSHNGVDEEPSIVVPSLFDEFRDEIETTQGHDDLVSLDEARRIIAPEAGTSADQPETHRPEVSMKNAERRATKYRVLYANRDKLAASVPPLEASEPQPDGAPAEEAPLEGVVVSHPPVEGTFDADAQPSSQEPDVIPGSAVDDSEPKKAPKTTKKAKKPKQPKQTQATQPDELTPATYSDDQFFGPEVDPLRKFVRTSEQYSDARTSYDKADNELAGKVARRLKLGMFASKKTRETATTDVEAVHAEYERMSETFDAIQIEKWKINNPDITDEEIDHKLANFHEAKLRLQGLRAQHEIVNGPGKFGKLSKLNNKATEWFAGLSRKQKIAVGVGGIVVGAAAGLAVAAAGTVLGGAAGVIGGGLLAGGKVYKTTAQTRAGLHRNTTVVDKADFKNANGSYKSIDELRAQSSASFKKSLDQRAEKADKINKKAKWMTIASVAMLGAGVAGHIDVVHDAYKAVEGQIADYWGFGDHHDITPPVDRQGGGSGSNPVSPLGSGDVNPNHQYSFPHHDDVGPVAPPAPVLPPEVVPQDMGGATEFNGAGLNHFNQWVNGHTVQPGESVWKLSQDYLQANGVKDPSVYQIDAVKDKVLAELSAKGLVDGNGWLSAGQQLFIK